MKKRFNDIDRLKTIIDNDRIGGGKDFENVFYDDVNKVIKEYFEICGDVILKMSKEQDFLHCELSFNAVGTKVFDCVPKSQE